MSEQIMVAAIIVCLVLWFVLPFFAEWMLEPKPREERDLRDALAVADANPPVAASIEVYLVKAHTFQSNVADQTRQQASDAPAPQTVDLLREVTDALNADPKQWNKNDCR